MTPYYQDSLVTLYCGDVLEIAPALPCHLVVTDPPYNVGVKYGDAYSDRRTRSEFVEWLGSRLDACECPEIVYFPGHVHLFDAPQIAARARARIRRLLGWHKREFAGDLWTSGPAISWEPIVWCGRPETSAFNKIFGHAGRDFLTVNSVHGDPFRGPHPCPKPLPVMRWLINLFATPGATVLDPFCGSGTTLQACKALGIPSVGIDIEVKYLDVAIDRLRQMTLDLQPGSAPGTTMRDLDAETERAIEADPAEAQRVAEKVRANAE